MQDKRKTARKNLLHPKSPARHREDSEKRTGTGKQHNEQPQTTKRAKKQPHCFQPRICRKAQKKNTAKAQSTI